MSPTTAHWGTCFSLCLLLPLLVLTFIYLFLKDFTYLFDGERDSERGNTSKGSGRGRRNVKNVLKKIQGTWVAQSIKSAFSSGHDPRVLGSSPVLGSPLSEGLLLPLSDTPPLVLFFFLSNK